MRPKSDDAAVAPVRLRSAWLMTSATSLALGMVVFAVSPLVSQVLGPNGRGRLVAIQLLPQLLADLAAAGLGYSIVHYGARQPDAIRSLLRWSLKRAALGSVVAFTLGQLLAAPVTQSHASDERLLRIYLFICPINAFLVIAMESIRASGDYKRWNLLVLAQGLSWPSALIIGVVPGDPSLERVVAVHLLISGTLLTVAWTMALRSSRAARQPPKTTYPVYLRYGFHSMVSTVPGAANAKLDQVIMSFRVDRDSLGRYAAAVGWSGLTIPVMRGLTGISMPHVSGASEGERLMRIKQLVTGGLAAIALLTVGGAVATLVLWRPLYGADYRSALSAAMVLIPAALLLEFNVILGNVLRSLDRPALVAALECVVLTFSITALLAAIEFDPVLGPALVSLGTYAGASLLYAGAIARHVGVPIRDLVDRHLIRTVKLRLSRRSTST